MNCVELRVKRAHLVDRARHEFLEKATRENREPTAEEQRSFAGMMDDADSIEEQYKRLERLESAEASLRQSRGRRVESGQPGYSPTIEQRSQGEIARSTPEYRAMYEEFIRGGLACLSAEYRALAAGNDPGGGYLLAPQQVVDEVLKFVDNTLIVRQLATKFTVAAAESLGAVSLDTDPADADWTTELGTGNEDSTMAFGKRELSPHPLAKRIKASNKLLQSSNGEKLVRERLMYKFAVSQEKAFFTGDGASKPLGIFTATSQGISTGRDISTDNTTTAITGDGLINAYYSLKQGYRDSKSCRWVMHRDAVKMARKLKDGSGQYLWQPGLQAGQPDSILGTLVIMSEYAPNTFTTGQYVGVVGDFSYYWIADARQMAIQRLVELYAETNQTGFIGRLETDGMPVLEEAFARLKLA